ncbi:MAG TPA: aquaporin [Actinomycetota bacterium]|nr:aquaporin [Actinomycetota bacterium]
MKRYVAEFIATFFLVFAATGAIVADQHQAVVSLQDTFGVLGVALAQGLALAVAIAAVGRISGGHANPAVSLAFYIARRLTLKDLGGYVAAQILGGLVAAVVVRQIFAEEIVRSVGAGSPGLAEGVSLLQGGLIEVVLTFFLVFVFWGVAVDPRGPKIIAPLAIGLTLVFSVLVGGPFTGAALNPARWFGPALVGGAMDANWPVWVLGPIVGALIASTAYELFFLDTEAPAIDAEDAAELEPRAPEILPPEQAEANAAETALRGAAEEEAAADATDSDTSA